MEKYYELKYDYDTADFYTDDLKFFYIDRFNGYSFDDVFNHVLKVLNLGSLTETELKTKDIFELNKYAFYELIQHELEFNNYEHNYDYVDYLDTLKEWLNDDGYLYEALDNIEEYYFINEWEDVLNAILNKLGFKLVRFNADRSTTCDAIAPIDFCDEFIFDIGLGKNFYTVIQYDEHGEFLDSLSGCYIKNETDLKEYINENFINNSDHINIVDNDEAYYLIKNNKTFKKFNKIIEKTYSFDPIK